MQKIIVKLRYNEGSYMTHYREEYEEYENHFTSK